MTITRQKTGQKVDQRIIGYVEEGVTVRTDLYKVVVTDTEDTNFRMEFTVTRDAWTVDQSSNIASNVGFEPKDTRINHFTAKITPEGIQRKMAQKH